MYEDLGFFSDTFYDKKNVKKKKPETRESRVRRIPGFRRLTRDSRNRRLTRDSRIPEFSHKNLNFLS